MLSKNIGGGGGGGWGGGGGGGMEGFPHITLNFILFSENPFPVVIATVKQMVVCIVSFYSL